MTKNMSKATQTIRSIYFYAVSIIALIVFYFSVSPMVRMLGHADAYSEADLKRRKAQVLEFVRRGLFTTPKEIVA